ncbi:MAG: DUF6512 family protein [Candidatus Caldarchaeales archaeon]
MDKNKKELIFKYELFGIFFIFLLGSILHFTFDISGGNLIIGLFSAVNESVWEHLKLCFFPSILYAGIEYRFIKNAARNFFVSKAVGAYIMPLIIVLSFYTYTMFIDENLALDILIFFMSIMVGQLTSYRLMVWEKTLHAYTKISIIAIILLAILFFAFTLYPPRLPIFQDPVSGEYGIMV